MRRSLFEESTKVVERHNNAQSSYTLELNQFADLTQDEFASSRLGELPTNPFLSSTLPVFPQQRLHLKDTPTVDWREKGAVLPVKDQGNCGSCWTFSTVSPMESHYFIKYGTLVRFAE